MPNSEVKRISADGSVGFPHVRVGHRQASNLFSLFKSEDKKVRKSPFERTGFFSPLGRDKNADMAQSVERILGKDEVPSSILGISTIYCLFYAFV